MPTVVITMCALLELILFKSNIFFISCKVCTAKKIVGRVKIDMLLTIML